MRRALAAAALAGALLAGCGDSGPTAEEQVRQTLDEFGRATAAKDYQALCDRVFAPRARAQAHADRPPVRGRDAAELRATSRTRA